MERKKEWERGKRTEEEENERGGGKGKGLVEQERRREEGREGLVRKFNTYWIRKRNFTVYI